MYESVVTPCRVDVVVSCLCRAEMKSQYYKFVLEMMITDYTQVKFLLFRATASPLKNKDRRLYAMLRENFRVTGLDPEDCTCGDDFI